MATTVEKALALREEYTNDRAWDVLGRADQELEHLHKKRGILLPAEQHASQEIQKRIGVLEFEKSRALFVKEHGGLPMLSKEVLGWRNSSIKGIAHQVNPPSLALVPIADTGMTISISDSISDSPDTFHAAGTSGYLHERPNSLASHYQDVYQQLRARSREALHNGAAVLSWQFEGVIPDSTRERIAEALLSETFTKDQVYLLCEAPADTWKYTETPNPKPRRQWDPIVIGHRADTLWVIDSFLPTSVEQYVLAEFTQLPQLNA